MLEHRLSLRLRIFLFFCLLGLGGVVLVLAGLWLGHARADPPLPPDPFVLAGLVASFGLLGLTTGIWLLFDENVAKPIERLAAQLRARAHGAVAGDMPAAVDTHAARYLGDLAPAAQAVSSSLAQSTLDTAEAVANHTARLAAETQRLTALLSDIPVAMLIVGPTHNIVLYDSQSAGVLAQIAHPRLNASIFDYFSRDSFEAPHAALVATRQEQSFTALGADGQQSYAMRMKPLGAAPGYMLIIDEAEARIAPDQARPLVYDFDLLDRPTDRAVQQTPLKDLTFVVFDSETTGLLPHKDEVVQLGAVRVLRGRIVEGEVFDMLVNPGMPIPPASTKVHHVSDAMVADAPDILHVGRRFHHFARDAVLVAHNAPFDLAFLHRHAPAMNVAFDHPVLDTVLMSAVLFGASERHTLDALCERLGITIPPELRHTALGDARATAEVLCRMLSMCEGRGFLTFGDLIAQTRKHGRLLEDMN